MFTSRAEFRLLLREDNADLRLTEHGRELGLVDDERWDAFCRKKEAVEAEKARLESIWLTPHNPLGKAFAAQTGIELSRETNAMDLLKRPEMKYQTLAGVRDLQCPSLPPAVTEQVEIQAKYAGYVARQKDEIERLQRNEATAIPAELDYEEVRGLSAEAIEKLTAVAPTTIGQAARVPGITPAAVSLLLVHLKRRGQSRQVA